MAADRSLPDSKDISGRDIRQLVMSPPVMLLMLGVLWGTSYPLIEVALRGLPAPVIACARQAVAAVALSPFLLTFVRSRRSAGDLIRATVVGVVLIGAPAVLLNYGQQWVTASLAAVLISTTPLLTALLAFRLDRSQRSTVMQWAGIICGLAGVALLFGVDLRGSLNEVLGGLLVLSASLCYATGGFLVGRWFKDTPALPLTAAATAGSALVLMPLAAVSVPGADLGNRGSWAAVVILGVGCTALGLVMYNSLLRRAGARVASTTHYLSPAFAVMIGLSLLGEPRSAALFVGLLLVLGGSWIAVNVRR